MQIQNVLFCLLLTLLSSLSASSNESCHKTRSAFDLGSGTFRFKVARVDTCLKKIEIVLANESIKTGFADAMVQGVLPKDAKEAGVKIVTQLFEKAKQLGATEHFAVGTQSFRNMKNSSAFFESIPKEIQAQVITQKQEAVLGYRSATTVLGNADSSIVVWDIGGRSMQIAYHKKKTGFTVYEGKVASLHVRDLLKKTRDAKSPNPIGKSSLGSAKQKVKAIISKDMREARVLDLLQKEVRSRRVIGIGNVLNDCAVGQIKILRPEIKSSYTLTDIDKTLAIQAEKNDIDIGGKYPDTDVSNLILISTTMKNLGVKQVEFLTTNLTDALLVSGFSF